MDDKTRQLMDLAVQFADAAMKPIVPVADISNSEAVENLFHQRYKTYRNEVKGTDPYEDALREGYLYAKYKAEGFDALLLLGEGGYGGPFELDTYWRAVRGDPDEIGRYYYRNNYDTDSDESDNNCFAVLRVIDLHQPPGGRVRPELRAIIDDYRTRDNAYRGTWAKEKSCSIDEMDKDGLLSPRGKQNEGLAPAPS